MPTSAANAREDQVIRLIHESLLATGHNVVLVDRPDRNRPSRIDDLTVDAEFSVDGERWALDVTTLRWRPSLEGAVERVKGALDREFRVELERSQTTLVLYCHPSAERGAEHSLVGLARAAIESGKDQRREDELAQLRPRSAGLEAIEVCPWLSETPDVKEEVVLSFGAAAAKKLKVQLTSARALGYRIALAIDQRGAEDLRFGANFLPSSATVASVVADLETQTGVLLDAVLLVGPENDVQWLRWAPADSR